MFDCGNSRQKHSKKEKSRDCSASVMSSASGSSYSMRSKYETSRRCLESDVICDLIDSLRYSGRGKSNDERRRDRILDYIDNRRNSGCKSSEKSKEVNCNKPFIKFDGGNSASAYGLGPIFDFGSAGPNVPEPVIPHSEGGSDNESVSPGNDGHCSRK